METKELKIIPPDGYEIDMENSTFECIKFKKKTSYEDVAKELFCNKVCYSTDDHGAIEHYIVGNTYSTDPNNATSEKQVKKLIAINKLMNVAKYLNGDWKPDWNNEKETKFSIGIEEEEDIYINDVCTDNVSVCYFKCPALAQQAIDILGEETVRLALSIDW